AAYRGAGRGRHAPGGVPVLHRRGQGTQPRCRPGPVATPLTRGRKRGSHATIRRMTDAAPRQPASARFALALLALFSVIWIALAIAPHYREDWMLENILVAIAVPVLAWGWRHLPLTRLSYSCLFAFGVLHEIGAHYTYAEV